MTDDATPDGIVRPQSVIGPITLGLNNGATNIELMPGSVLTPAALKLTGAVGVTAVTASAGSLTIETDHGPIAISGIHGGAAPAVAPGSQLVSIARSTTHVTVNLKGGGGESALPFAAGAGIVTVSVTAASAI